MQDWKKGLNEDQAAAFDQLVEFYKSGEQNVMFLLKGYAGTGKTFLISRFIEWVSSQKVKQPFGDAAPSCAMTAPTNKAVQVLRESFKAKGDVTFKTIHSLLGLKERIKDSGEIEFVDDHNEPGSGPQISNYDVLVLDEVSMLQDDLFFKIRAYNNEVKIIMMGDPAQIPPIGKRDSEPLLRTKEHGIVEAQLNKIMRQAAGSSIVRNSFAIREIVRRATEAEDELRKVDPHAVLTDPDNEFMPVFETGHDLEIMKMPDQRQQMREKFLHVFRDITVSDHTKVIAWGNKKVMEYNRYIRSIFFGLNAPKIKEGERLVMNSPHTADSLVQQPKSSKRRRVAVDVLTTNQEVIVERFDVELKELKTKQWFKCYNCVVRFKDKDGIAKQGRINIIHEDYHARFQNELNKIKDQALRGEMSARKGHWKRYYELLRSVADVSYAYAITAHKAQGSTYKQTFIDASNICANSNIVERNRILYTALTRANTECTVII